LLLKVPCGCPSVREDLRASAGILPGHRFYGIKNSAHEKQNFSFSMKRKRSENRPVEEGDWRIGRSLPGNHIHGRPVGSEDHRYLFFKVTYEIDSYA
jgi:hypothetical protein